MNRESLNKYITEFIGTFFLVLTITLSRDPLTIGCVLTALIYAGYPLSGAHFNPAVTAAVMIRKMITLKEGLFYVLFQLTGAMAGSFSCYLIWGNTHYPRPLHDINVLKPFFVETAFTFLYVWVVLLLMFNPKAKDNQYYGIAAGFVMITAFFMGRISGGAFNPAYAVGTIIIDSLFCGCPYGSAALKYLWLYLTGPFLGGITATLLIHLLNPVRKGTDPA